MATGLRYAVDYELSTSSRAIGIQQLKLLIADIVWIKIVTICDKPISRPPLAAEIPNTENEGTGPTRQSPRHRQRAL